MPCCGSVGGCGARAVSRKTPIYFIVLLYTLPEYRIQSTETNAKEIDACSHEMQKRRCCIWRKRLEAVYNMTRHLLYELGASRAASGPRLMARARSRQKKIQKQRQIQRCLGGKPSNKMHWPSFEVWQKNPSLYQSNND